MILRNLAFALALAAPHFQYRAGHEKDGCEGSERSAGPGVRHDGGPRQIAKDRSYKGKTYYFCSIDDKKEFDKAPATYIKLDKKDTTKK